MAPLAGKLSSSREVGRHRLITEAVHAEGGKICMQILHAGRYGYHPLTVAPSAIKSPITPFRPRALSARGIEGQISDFVRCAELAQKAGYDGVEIMGSEGYLINQFIVKHTNHRDDEWGGAFANRMRFPVEIVRRTREAVGKHFIIIYRLSMLDLVREGSSWDEIVQLGKAVEAAGVSLINTGIGWHEARVPTIGTMVPRAGFSWVTRRMRGEVGVPLITTNRINTPEVAENVLQQGDADMVSMARPLLADPDFVLKAGAGRAQEINTCIACNQACLDHAFQGKTATCLVNPRACNETTLNYLPAQTPKRLAVVGAGPAGLAFATVAAQRGHDVTLFDADDEIGGQFNYAKRIPGKEEFSETLRYYRVQLERTGVRLKLNTRVTAEHLNNGQFDRIVLATGVTPRMPAIEGIDHPSVLSYLDVLRHDKPVGQSVAIIGAGGIGFDVAEFLLHAGHSTTLDPERFFEEWGVDTTGEARGGLEPEVPDTTPSRRLWLLQRRESRLGAGLGKTTGWIHRATLRRNEVQMMPGVRYEKIDDRGLHVTVGGKPQLLAVDNVVICAGQEPQRDLAVALKDLSVPLDLIGGADKAVELDAKRAIDQGSRLAAEL